MTIDKEEIKALALACAPSKCADEAEEDRRLAEFHSELTPEAILALLAEIKRLSTSRSKKERELEQELETWRHGPFCWTCGDTGDVHDITGEWRGECDCLSAQLINANRERDQLKAENEALRTALSECIASLAGEMNQKYAGQKPEDMHPVTLRDYHRDIAELAGYRAAMAKEASHG